jgi:hypothetical protein
MEKFQPQKEVVQHSVIATIISKVDIDAFQLTCIVLHIIPGSLPYIYSLDVSSYFPLRYRYL